MTDPVSTFPSVLGRIQEFDPDFIANGVEDNW